MPKLSDYFISDLNTFINTDEFSKIVKIDGREMNVMIDNDLLNEQNLSNGGEGLARGELLFHVKKSDFIEEPFIDKKIRFNNNLYRISDIQEDVGLYTITLVGYRS